MTGWVRGSWIIFVTAAACSGTRPTPDQAPTQTQDGGGGVDAGARIEAPDASAPLCLPVVSGCGCAYVCGTSMRRNDDGSYEIVHDRLDSTTVTADVQQWCFDAAGHGSPAPPTGGTGCRDVFYDRSACGGECIPTTQYLACYVDNEGRCVP
jgi:hypothetical protein